MRLAEMLDLPIFEEVKLVTGANSLENEVLGITLLDAPDGYKWFREGEFLITTGYPFIKNGVSWEQGLLNLIEILVEKKCSGLGLKIGRYIPHVPKSAYLLADKHDIPILELPDNLSWSDLIVPVVTYINKEQRQELEKTHDVYEKFHALFKSNGDLQDIAYLLHQITNKPVTIYNNYDQIKIDFPLKIMESDDLSSLIDAYQQKIKDNFNESTIQDTEYVVHWIQEDGQIDGGIFFWDSETDYKSWEIVAIEQAKSIIRAEIGRVKSISEISQRYRNDFLSTLLHENNESHEALLRRASEVGWTIVDNYYVVVLDFDDKDKNSTSGLQTKMNILQSLNIILEKVLPGTLSGFDSQNRFILLIQSINFANETNIMDRVKKILIMSGETTFYGGIGRDYSTCDGISESYNEAIIASKLASKRKTGNSSCIYSFSQLSYERILFSQNPQKEAENIGKELIGAILQHDQERKSDLFITLTTFLKNNGNFQQTAEELFVHINTVRYRINTIRELTDYNPQKINDQMLFKIALTVFEINNHIF
jgi:PucR family transcriptional regulator, purine catabolism regulatory protein